MRKYISLIIFVLLGFSTYAVEEIKNEDKIVLSVVVEDFPEDFPPTARVQITNKFQRILTSKGISSVNFMNRFALDVVATPLTKDVIPGPPAMIAQNIDFSFYIVDNIDKKVFASSSVSTKGVGTNEDKAYLDAIKRLNLNNKGIEEMIESGKEKILAYYNSELETIVAQAKTLSGMKRYEEALYMLSLIPSMCEKYDKVLELALVVYQQYLDQQCVENLALAKTAWMSEQNSEGAKNAAEYLSQIYPDAACYSDAEELYKEIKAKVLDDWNFEMKQYQDGIDLEKQKIDAWKEVGIAYGEHQQPISNTITWLVN